jgi:hypothetical protein
MARIPLVLLAPALLTACLAPGAELVPEPGDFAFLEIRLQG